MKIIYANCHAMVVYFVLLCFSAANLNANAAYPEKDNHLLGDPPTRIIITNWQNTMGCYDLPNSPCLALAADNFLVFRIETRVGVPDVSPHPAMRIKYHHSYVLDGIQFFVENVTETIDNSMLVPIVLPSGETVYEATFDILVDLDRACVLEIFDVEMGYQLIGPDDQPYNIALEPRLFPPDLFIIPDGRVAEQHIEDKSICCSGFGIVAPECELGGGPQQTFEDIGGGLDIDRFGTSQAQNPLQDLKGTVKNISVSPNPFDASFNVKYQMQEAGEITFSCMDAQGRLIAQRLENHASAGSYEIALLSSTWPPGIYFLNFQSGLYTQMHKIVKLNE